MSDPRIGPGSIVGLIADAVANDVSATAALGQFRGQGGQMGNEAWYSLFGEVRGAIGNREAVQALNYDAPVPGEAMSTWAAGEAGQQATFVTSYLHVPGERAPRPEFYIHVTDGPHTPGEAIDAAQNQLSQGLTTGTGVPGEVVLGSVVTSVARMTGRRTG